jgi:hypothetical protein
MSEQCDYERNAAVKSALRANTSSDIHLPALVQRGLHFADRMDYLIRQWVIPEYYEISRSPSPPPFFRWSWLSKHARGVSRSTPPSSGLSEVQAAIGRYLRAEYDLAQPIPDRLVDLLSKLEQRSGKRGSEGGLSKTAALARA